MYRSFAYNLYVEVIEVTTSRCLAPNAPATREILDYSKLDNVGREEALIRRAIKPNSSLNIDSNSDSNSNSNIDYNIDPALDLSQNPTTNSAIDLPIIPTHLEQDHLLANCHTIPPDSDIDNEMLDAQSNLQAPFSNINPSESISQITSAPSIKSN